MSLPKPYYDWDNITIYCGKCEDILPEIKRVDLVLSDPPYGINIVKVGEAGSLGKVGGAKPFGNATSNRIVPKEYIPVYGDDHPFDHTPLLHKGDKIMLFGGNYYADKLPPSSCWLVWDKDNTGNFADCELVWTNLKGAVRKYKYRWNGCLQQQMHMKEERFHPTQKPIPLMRWCIEKAGDVKTILDPYMGSGSTLVAAKQLHIRAIGIEVEPLYCEVAISRLSQGVLPL